MKYIWLAVMLILAGASPALSQKMAIDPLCKSVRNKVGCTCAVQNGGSVTPDGKHWAQKRSNSAPPNEAYLQCMRKAGRL